jgi:hypothetical protein
MIDISPTIAPGPRKARMRSLPARDTIVPRRDSSVAAIASKKQHLVGLEPHRRRTAEKARKKMFRQARQQALICRTYPLLLANRLRPARARWREFSGFVAVCGHYADPMWNLRFELRYFPRMQCNNKGNGKASGRISISEGAVADSLMIADNRLRCARYRPRQDSSRSGPRLVPDRSSPDFPSGALPRSECRSIHFREQSWSRRQW